MGRLSESLPPLRSLVAVAALFFVVEAGLVLLAPLRWLPAYITADDFYYYLVLAKNLAAGLGATFDGVEPTNGFHPMYLLLLTMWAKLPVAVNPSFLVQAGLLTLLVFHNATGVVMGWAFMRQNAFGTGWLGALLWWANPWALAIALHGVEAPIAVFLWAVIIFNIIDLRTQSELLLWHWFGVGILIGLAILARTDGLLLLGAIWLTDAVRVIYAGNSTRRNALIRRMTVVGGAAFLVTVPWWWWNWHNFGMIMQVSGKATFLLSHGFAPRTPDFLITRTIYYGSLYARAFLKFTAVPLLLLVFILWQTRDLMKETMEDAIRFVLLRIDFVLVVMLLLAGWYAGRQWHVQNWYLLPSVLGVTVIAVTLWQAMEEVQPSLNSTAAVRLIGSASIILAVFIGAGGGVGFGEQMRGYMLATWLNQNTEADAVIGAWNSGIIGYFTERQVVNLDGVVNNSVYHYKVENRTLGLPAEYVRQRGITHITDLENLHLVFTEPAEHGLSEVYRSPEYGFTVYQVKP